MKCPQCGRPLKKVEVKAAGAQTKAVSYQCAQRDYFEFEPASSKKVIPELRESPLKIRQKVIKLSQERLGIYVKNHQLKLVAWFLSSSKLHRSFESTAKSDFAFVIRSPHAQSPYFSSG